MKTRRLHIQMGYAYIGDTGIDVPEELLEGKTEEEQLQAAFDYACEHVNDIPLASNAEYIPNSEDFELEDVDWEDYDE